MHKSVIDSAIGILHDTANRHGIPLMIATDDRFVRCNSDKFEGVLKISDALLYMETYDLLQEEDSFKIREIILNALNREDMLAEAFKATMKKP